MRRFRDSGAAAYVLICALLAIAACVDEPVGVDISPQRDVIGTDPGSHFRYATLSWAPTGTLGSGEVEFRLIAGFRRAAYAGEGGTGADGLPITGDVFRERVGATSFDFGDGTGTAVLSFSVVSFSVAEDWVVGEALDPSTLMPGIRHTYSGAGPFTASLARPFGFGARVLPNRSSG